VARKQLRALGVTPGQINGWVERGRLTNLLRGVYLVGPVMAAHAREMAAVLACGPGAVLSHLWAAYLYELLPYPAKAGPIDVTVTQGHPGRHAEVRVHRAALAPHEIRERHDIPVTAPIRTIIDIAASAPDELDEATAEAIALRLTSGLLDAGPARTRSRPERVLLKAIRATDLPQPLANHRIGPWEADLYWPDHDLVVEVDGYAAHSSPRAFERDRRKDAELRAQGITVQRFSANAVGNDLAAVVAWVASALG
jgi:very-short-patch-repair endonuclease